MAVFGGILMGCALWFLVRCVLMGLYTVDQNERAVKTVFGRAQRVEGGKTTLDDAISERLRPEERERYIYPLVRVIPPGGPYFRMPWEKVHKVSIATSTVNMAVDVEDPKANSSGTLLEAVTKDQLNTGLTGQIRFRVSEANLYAYLFGIKQPIVHVMAYFVSVLRQKIASFEAKPISSLAPDATPTPGAPPADIIRISINDLRKNLRDLNDYMDQECTATAARYGVVFDASLITGIDPSRRSRVRPGRHQHRAQSGLQRHQPRPGQRGPEDRPVQARRRNRNPQGAGRGRTPPPDGRPTVRTESPRPQRAPSLPPQRQTQPLLQGTGYLPRQNSCGRGGAAMTILEGMSGLTICLFTFAALLIAEPLLLGVAKVLGLYANVQERTCRVYVLFGKVIGEISEPGLHILPWSSAPAPSSSTCSASAMCSTSAWTRSTSAASPSTPKKARPWASASGTKCRSATRWPTCSRTLTRAAPSEPMSATPPSAA